LTSKKGSALRSAFLYFDATVNIDGAFNSILRLLVETHSQPTLVTTARSRSARHVNNERVKFRVHWSVDYWPIWQFFRWIIPWSPLGNSALNGVSNQSTDLVAL